MGCGASVEQSGRCDAAAEGGVPEAQPDRAKISTTPVDPSKLASICRRDTGQHGAWLDGLRLLLVSGDNGAQVHPLEVLDTSSYTFTKVGSVSGLAWPRVASDGQRYAAVAGLEVQVRSTQTHETLLTFTAPGQTPAYVSSMEFSPDGQHIAVVVDNVCTVYNVEGASLLTVEGEKSRMFARWYDADTLLSINEWIIYCHTLSSKELLSKWELPQGSIAEVHIAKDKKLCVSDDNAHLHQLQWNPDMKAFDILQTFQAPPGNFSGPSNLMVFEDQQTVLYEPGGGGHFRLHNLETGEICEVKRGQGPEEGLPSVSTTCLSPTETHVATFGFAGFELFCVGRATPEA